MFLVIRQSCFLFPPLNLSGSFLALEKLNSVMLFTFSLLSFQPFTNKDDHVTSYLSAICSFSFFGYIYHLEDDFTVRLFFGIKAI